MTVNPAGLAALENLQPVAVHLALIASAFLWSVVLHELGHFYYFRAFLKKEVTISLGVIPGSGTRLRVGRPIDYAPYSTTQRANIYLAGIAAGMIPFIILTVYAWPYIILIVPYLYGCRHDLKNIRRSYKNGHSKKHDRFTRSRRSSRKGDC